MARADMHRLEARVASFAAVTRPKRSVKPAFPFSIDTHPQLTPEILAAAGFYHTPVEGEEDACTCFLCPLALSGWDADDNPHIEHLGRDKPCAWKELVCTLEVDRLNGGPGRLRTEYDTADELPNSDKRTALRLETFGNWWPHAQPSAQQKLAQAGFISTPSKSAPDGTMCPLCRYMLEEWEESDDPMDVHKRKEPDCPFFTATVGKKPKGRRMTKATSKRATNAAQEPPQPDENAVEAEEAVAPPKRRSRPPKNSTASTASTATTKPRAKRKTAAEKRAEEAAATAAAADDSLELPPDEDPDASIVLFEPVAPARTTRSRSSSKAPTLDEVRATKPLPRKGRARKTTQNETESAAAAELASRATRSAPTRAPTPPPKSDAREAPLSQLERFANVPPPPSLPKSSQAGKEVPGSPSVVHAVAGLVKAVSGAEGPTALAPQDRALTLEEFVRRQFRVRHDELREQGEAVIAAWEGKVREGRERVERAFAS